MKAIVYKQYGPPEVAQVTDIPKPLPQPNEVLIRIISSTVNRTDSGFRSAEYFVSRFWSGLFRPKLQVLGCEFAGIIEAIGSNVTGYKPGDKVLGFSEKKFATHAEYITLPESESFCLMPDNLSFDVAAALTEGGHYALVDIRAAKVKAGQKVMVYGATGAIGSAAVQLLKVIGAHVTAVCAGKHKALIQSLGADLVIDYQTEDFTQISEPYDFIFDAVGKSSFGICKPMLKEQGIYISTELGKNGENIWYALRTSYFSSKKLLFPIPVISKADVEYLAELAGRGAFKPLIDRSYPMEDIVEAYRYVESGQKVGNVILHIQSAESNQ